MIIANYIALVLVLLGALNWGLVGIFGFNLVTWITMATLGWMAAIYVIILLSAIWLIISIVLSRGMLDLGCQYRREAEKRK